MEEACPAEFGWPAPAVTECPYRFYEALRTQEPVFECSDGHFLVARAEDIIYVSKHPELFSNDIFLGQGRDSWRRGSMAFSDPPHHKRKRGLGLKLVARDRLRGAEPLVRSIVDELIDVWIGRGECDFRTEFADLLPVYVITELLGLPRDDVPQFKQWHVGHRESEDASLGTLSDPQFGRYEETRDVEYDYLRRELIERRDGPRDDFLSDLVHTQIRQDGDFDLEYLIAETSILLFAGNVTTSHMITSTMTLLCQYPEQLRRVRDDHTLIKALCEESLRFESPVQFIGKTALEDVELNGARIPAGSAILVLMGSGNRDAELFEDADTFAVDRPDVAKRHLAFGYGQHLCLGAPLARLEGQLAYESLLTRLDNISLDEEKSDLSHTTSVKFRAPRKLHITFDRRTVTGA